MIAHLSLAAALVICPATPVKLVYLPPLPPFGWSDPYTVHHLVYAEATVSGLGIVTAVRVVKSSGDAKFDSGVLEMLANAKFKSATKSCRPITAAYTLVEGLFFTE